MAEPERLARAKKQLEPVLAEDVFATEQIEKIIENIDDLPPELMREAMRQQFRGDGYCRQ